MTTSERGGPARPWRTKLLLAFAFASATLLTAASSPVSASTVGAAVKGGSPAPFPGAASESGESSMLSSADGPITAEQYEQMIGEQVAQLSGCVFETKGDNVHKSGGDASGHGWWISYGGCGNSAVVTVQLQEYYCGGTVCWWQNFGTKGKATVASGGGAGNRATGRATCATSTLTGWRSEVDVDIVGISDPSDKLHTNPQNITCRIN